MTDTTTSEMIRMAETIVRLERELQKAQADAAAMREALEKLGPWLSASLEEKACQEYRACAEAGLVALSTNAGRELLADLQRLRDDYAELVKRNAECEKQLAKFNGEDLRLQNEGYQLRDDLAKAHAQCAKLRSEVERAWHEGFIDGDFGEASADDCWNQSRARKVATGEVT